jgi:UDP-4-amino-4,6-dideoxy-N-acetyl-beta-L-altrosamine transaminase
MSEDFLPYGRQTIEADDLAAVTEALQAPFLTTGPLVERFEAAFAERVGASAAIACANGTAALHLAMLALDIRPGEAVIVPSTTFLATANCVRYVGGEVVFADVDPASGLMTPQTLAEAFDRVGDRLLRAVIPVHLRGDAVDLPALQALAQAKGAVLVEDAAHALGTTMTFEAGRSRVGDGRHSALTTFSFHPVKTICTGEGGLVTTNDPALAARVRALRSHGMMRPAHGPAWWYEMPEIGFNYRLPDLLCALGLSQLAKLDRFAERRRALAAAYADALAPLDPLVRPAASPPWSRTVPHLMSVLVNFEAAGRDRTQVIETLRARGIGTQVHYIPVHRQPYYQARYGAQVLPGAEAWYARALSLPLYPAMDDADVSRVATALAEALGA